MKEKILKEQINNIRQQAVESGHVFPFPWIYKSFKNLGIVSCSIDLESGKTIFIHPEVKLEEQAPEKNFIFGSFNSEQIVSALQKHQKGETSYDEWLDEMARAGVHRYIVTMPNDIVIYLDQHNTQAHVESIPSV